jgi:hypothetical protein
MKKAQLLLLGAALAVLPGTLAAQQSTDAGAQAAPAVARTLERSFTYLGSDLRVTISSGAPGTIELMRGDAGILRLTASASGGLPGAGFDASQTTAELTLSAPGAEKVDYLLEVPTDVRVTVRVAGQPGVTMGTLDRTASWRWQARPSTLQALPQ